MSNHEDQHDSHQHHILSDKMGMTIFIGLIIGTIVTVVSAKIDLGVLNFPLAMLIATSKAMLVVLFFMGLKYDTNDNRAIFGSGLIFLAIFLILTFADLFFRGPVHYDFKKLNEVFLANAGGSGGVKIKMNRFWEPRNEVLAHGKTLFGPNCASCHGNEGKGDGPAAAALNPKPRNFTADADWKNGRKPSQIYGTLSKGLNTMPAFSTLPPDDRYALALYVSSLGTTQLKDSGEDLAKAGINSSLDDGGLGSGGKTLPIDFAIEVMSEK